MHRFLCAKNVSHNKFKLLSTPNCWDLCCASTEPKKNFSQFCINNFEQFNKIFSTGFKHTALSINRVIKTSTSTANVNLAQQNIIVTKKKRKCKKNLIELIQINGGTLKQTKATVKKLKSKQLNEFIGTPQLLVKRNDQLIPEGNNKLLTISNNDAALNCQKYSLISIDPDAVKKNDIEDESPILFVGKESVEFRKGAQYLTDIIESLKIFKEMHSDTEFVIDQSVDFIPTKNSVFAMEDIEAHHHLDEHIEPIEAIVEPPPTEKRNRKQPKTAQQPSKDQLIAKQKSLDENLSAYLEVCVNNGLTNRALVTLMNYRSICNRSKHCLNIQNINLYNIILSGFAEKGNYNKIKEILLVLQEDNISCNAQSFAYVLECLGRNFDHTKHIQKHCNEAKANGITLNDIMDQSHFVSDKREICLDAIRRIEPNFNPVYKPPAFTYSNKLLQSLNDNVVPIEKVVDKSYISNETQPGSEVLNAKQGFTKDELMKMAHEQLKIEMDSVIVVNSVEYFPEINDLVLHYRKHLKNLQENWRVEICGAFKRDLNILRAQTHSKGNRSISLFPYLRALDVEQYADILLHEIRILAEGSETFSLTVSQLYRQIGQKVQSKYLLERKWQNGVLDKTVEIYDEYCNIISEQNSSDNSRQCWQRLVHHSRHNGPSLDINDVAWPKAALYGIGRFLYQILMRDVKIDVNVVRPNSKSSKLLPAFYTLFRNEGKFVKEEVKPHPVLARLFRGSQQQTLTFDANLVPMVCPPQPWSTPTNGGYLLTRSELLRLPQQAYQQWDRINHTHSENMYPALDSLNQLASVPWKVNTQVLDVILKVFNDGGSKELDVPQPPSALPPLDFDKNAEISKKEKFIRFRNKLAHRRKQSEMYSLWCDALYRLSLANHFRNKVFWLPHNMDFRGRVYPLPPHLNHLGSDLARCLLVFHQAQPLGEDGLSWLKLHCINLTGLKKKCSIQDRLEFADEILDDIIDSADNPLTGRMWWAKSDEPWQTLSTCMEITNVIRSPDPTKYLSSFPVHQDGSCNGLQHYSALGRDTAGAISVNLASISNVPQDVYSDVAALVEEARKKEAAKGTKVAAVLDGYVRRAVIKQTVMTTVYGVTRFGARLQIARQLKDIESFPKEWVWPASSFLTSKTFESLREMFTSTKEIQDWFTHCARLIAHTGGQNVEWITPLGLPVVQPYNRFEKKTALSKNSKLSEHITMDMHSKPNVMKQKNAFPPNFIHSLDSSHMMLTSLHCERNGLTFMSVHDCYWTHACNVAHMNKICREQFVALHSEPILEDLSKYLVEKYSYSERDFENDGSAVDLTRRSLNKVLLQLPSKGDFDLSNVLKSVYFFS